MPTNPVIHENVSLKAHNTFGVDAKTRYLVRITHREELTSLLQDPEIRKLPKLIIGGGSNILLTRDFNGLVILNEIEGIEIIKESGTDVWIRAYAGENWHQFVMYCISKGLGGIENLSLIPGKVGAAPIQNIGAYGVELKDVFEELEAVEIETGKIRTFDHEACRFGYRNSIFKQAYKGKYMIVSVTLRLTSAPEFNTSYGALQSYLETHGISQLSLRTISDAVIAIRQSKLPDPSEIGNAGSFFKNPEIPETQYHALKEKYPDLRGYPTEPGFVKVPAGWLIEKAGWKGKRIDRVGTHAKQALVLVNYGNATGEEAWELAKKIRESVNRKFDILLEPEVNVI